MVPKLVHATESPGGLIRTEILGSPPHTLCSFWFSKSVVRPTTFWFEKLPGENDAACVGTTVGEENHCCSVLGHKLLFSVSSHKTLFLVHSVKLLLLFFPTSDFYNRMKRDHTLNYIICCVFSSVFFSCCLLSSSAKNQIL